MVEEYQVIAMILHIPEKRNIGTEGTYTYIFFKVSLHAWLDFVRYQK